MDIPPVVRGFTQDVLGLGAAATSAIAIELSIVATCCSRAGWLLRGRYAVFLVVLGTQMASGAAASETVTLAPWQMAASTSRCSRSGLSRPDRRLRGSVGSRRGPAGPVRALATWAPFHFFKTGPAAGAHEQVADAGPTGRGRCGGRGCAAGGRGAVDTVDGELYTPEVPAQEPETAPTSTSPTSSGSIRQLGRAGRTPRPVLWSKSADNAPARPLPRRGLPALRDVCARHRSPRVDGRPSWFASPRSTRAWTAPSRCPRPPRGGSPPPERATA